MGLPKQRGQTSFFDIPFLLDDDFFNRDEPYSLFREKILPALRDVQSKLDELYCEDNGRPAVDPVIVAGATLLQFLEKKPDRQAASAVRLNLGPQAALLQVFIVTAPGYSQSLAHSDNWEFMFMGFHEFVPPLSVWEKMPKAFLKTSLCVRTDASSPRIRRSSSSSSVAVAETSGVASSCPARYSRFQRYRLLSSMPRSVAI